MKKGVIDRGWIYARFKRGEAYIRALRRRSVDPETGKVRLAVRPNGERASKW
jgi:hypothetical protein